MSSWCKHTNWLVHTSTRDGRGRNSADRMPLRTGWSWWSGSSGRRGGAWRAQRCRRKGNGPPRLVGVEFAGLGDVAENHLDGVLPERRQRLRRPEILAEDLGEG